MRVMATSIADTYMEYTTIKAYTVRATAGAVALSFAVSGAAPAELIWPGNPITPTGGHSAPHAHVQYGNASINVSSGTSTTGPALVGVASLDLDLYIDQCRDNNLVMARRAQDGQEKGGAVYLPSLGSSRWLST
jgi:hypothetical protein